ncbi:MAG: sugar nucleotide-binding protein [Kiritimatiellales bacterium]|nr:sugar nucleotide-binding protein [Kiritimatiellales bacterium]
MKNILITGSKGQLGTDCHKVFGREADGVSGVDLPEVDLSARSQCLDVLDRVRPDLIVNCAAYTAVDACEADKSCWPAEFLAASGFSVVATTLDASAEEMIERRKASLIAKGVPHDLRFRASAMEYIHQTVSDLEPFDAIYVHEALHHAHDWKKSIKSFSKCLRPGGWCFILNEPNLIHTFSSYRVARLSNTHEIGISPVALKKQLNECGFDEIRIFKNRIHWFMQPILIAARKR